MHQKRLIPLCSGICPVGPSRKVKAAIRKAVKNVRQHPDPRAKRLRRLFFSKYGVHEEGILFANSMREILYLIFSVCNPGKVLVLGPAVGIYEEVSAATGSEITYFHTEGGMGFAPDTSLMEKSLDGIELVFIANPNRITGKLLDGETLQVILSMTSKRGIKLVLDESLIEFSGYQGFDSNLLNVDNLITVRTTAHFYGLPGLELAYAVSSPSFISEMEKKRHGNINCLSVEAARAALKDKVYKKLAKAFTDEERELFRKTLTEMAGLRLHDSDSNMLLIQLDGDAEKIRGLLESAGFSLENCSDVKGLEGQFLRVSVMKHDHNLKLLRILRRCV